MRYWKQNANTGNGINADRRTRGMAVMTARSLLAIALFMTCLPLTMLNAAATASDQTSPALYIDGQKTAYKTVTVAGKGENMVGLRQAASALKLALTWSAVGKEWTISGGEKPIRVKLNAREAFVGGKATMLAVPLREEKNTVYIPLRFVIEASGGEMQFYKGGGINVIWALSHSQNQLNRAIMDGDAEAVKRLLRDWRAAALPMGVDGIQPYTFASENLPVTKALIEAGFPVDYREDRYADVIMSSAGYTLLHGAAGYGRTEVVQYLLDQGADPTLISTLPGGREGWQPIDHAVHGLLYSPIRLQIFGLSFNDDAIQDYMDTLRLLRPHSGLQIYFKDRKGDILATGDDLSGYIEPDSSSEVRKQLEFAFKDQALSERMTDSNIESTIRIFINDVQIGYAKVPQSMKDGTISFVSEYTSEEQFTGMAAMIRLALDGSDET
ncbi:stalk domain-containing protein [Paenibacillus methanolicus]|uniref:Ankyrin repeat protein n=1 Tax=Paenibacillus methanolicus TaxID=582686 RepID=A0A5S5C969_9BACL|nr:stalk domain-containing protein [Paenibacillus methanolicus]TYP74870.1 ankyrin repeat protein [Paenibacillus methanolicus]